MRGDHISLLSQPALPRLDLGICLRNHGPVMKLIEAVDYSNRGEVSLCCGLPLWDAALGGLCMFDRPNLPWRTNDVHGIALLLGSSAVYGSLIP